MSSDIQNIIEEIKTALTATLASISGADSTVTITGDTNVVRDLGLDSLAVMNFVMDLEDKFDVSIPLDKIAEVETVADLAKAILDLRGSR